MKGTWYAFWLKWPNNDVEEKLEIFHMWHVIDVDIMLYIKEEM